MYICEPHTWLAPTEAIRQHQIPWEQELQAVVTAMWVLGIEPRSSARATSLLNLPPSLQSPVYFLISHISRGLTSFIPNIVTIIALLFLLHIITEKHLDIKTQCSLKEIRKQTHKEKLIYL